MLIITLYNTLSERKGTKSFRETKLFRLFFAHTYADMPHFVPFYTLYYIRARVNSLISYNNLDLYDATFVHFHYLEG